MSLLSKCFMHKGTAILSAVGIIKRSSDITNGTNTLHHSRHGAQSELGLFQSS